MNRRLLFLWLVVGACQFASNASCLVNRWAYNGGLSDDEALALALTRSLNDVPSTTDTRADDEALARAIQESLLFEQPTNGGLAPVAEQASSSNRQAGTCCMETECAICLEKYDDTQVSILPCKHAFCTECINRSMASGGPNSNRCPICRMTIDRSQIVSGSYSDLKPGSQAQKSAAERERAKIAQARPAEPVQRYGINTDSINQLILDQERDDALARMRPQIGYMPARYTPATRYAPVLPVPRIPWERIERVGNRRKFWQRTRDFFRRRLLLW